MDNETTMPVEIEQEGQQYDTDLELSIEQEEEYYYEYLNAQRRWGIYTKEEEY